MQYSSPLISSKLRAELATYVRQLCKISDRAHVQNLTGRELQDNDRERQREGGDTGVTGKVGETTTTHKQCEEMSCLHVLYWIFIRVEIDIVEYPSKASGQRPYTAFLPLAPSLLAARDV